MRSSRNEFLEDFSVRARAGAAFTYPRVTCRCSVAARRVSLKASVGSARMRVISRAAYLAAYLAVVAFAFVFVWFVGHRGVFLLDQSILFDGAWRVFQGQVPYRDFYSAFPPVAFFIQALFFRISG